MSRASTARSSLEKKSLRGHRTASGKIIGSRETNLYSIKEESEIDVAKYIVEEIVNSALEKIYHNYMEQQTVKFTVHCAHEALCKLVKFYYYRHNHYDFTKDERWLPDQLLEPSPADSWGVNQVEIGSLRPEDHELNTVSKIRLQMRREKGECDDGGGSFITPSSSESSLSEGVEEYLGQWVSDLVDNLPLDEVDRDKQSLSLKLSNFTMVAEGMKDYNEFELSPHVSELSLVTKDKNHPLGGLQYIKKENEDTYDVALEIRGCARYKAHVEPPTDPKEEEKKKKRRS